MSSKLKLAKPSGISLSDHTLHVVEQAELILSEIPFLSIKYKAVTGGDLRKELIDAAKYHDWGKAYPKWQDACQKDYQIYLKWRTENGLNPDEVNAEEYRRYNTEMYKTAGENLMKSGLRHELASLYYLKNYKVKISTVARTAIAAHHGKLGFQGEKRWKEDGRESELEEEGPFYEFWKAFKRLSYRIKELSKGELIIERYKYSVVRGLLQLADTRASRKEGEGDDAVYQFEKFELKNKYDSLRPVQESAKKIASEKIAILRAPTGSGKTYASLLWADLQINPSNKLKQKADRLVIAMPTRFTSNALSVSVAEQIDETGLYHSSAWFNRYGDLDEKTAIKNAKEAHRMAKYLATPVSVCTIDHLLICLTGAKEAHHTTFTFLANSAVVFDEADFYDDFVQGNIVELLKVLRTLNVPVLIMSATVPDSARTLYDIDFPIEVPVFEKLSCKKHLQIIGQEEELTRDDLLIKMLQSGTGIIYANTVARALEYYRFFENHSLRNDIPLVMYHSRFTEYDKKDIEEKLIALLGQKAWKENDKKPVRGIAIMTQIGEMSVNISTPLMISDLCPWDRLAQRIGRLVRFDECNKGFCYIIEPLKDNDLYPAPYGSYDRKERKWIANEPLLNTKKKLEKDFFNPEEIAPEDLEKLVNDLYPSAPDILGRAAYNQKEYRNLMKEHWLLLPDKYTDEDDGHVEKWSSRHIPAQQTIFTEFRGHFINFAEYQAHALEFGISCPVYSIEKEMRKKENSKINKEVVLIGKSDKPIDIYYLANDFDYDKKLGLAFLYE